jgi:hypothetical protein
MGVLATGEMTDDQENVMTGDVHFAETNRETFLLDLADETAGVVVRLAGKW